MTCHSAPGRRCMPVVSALLAFVAAAFLAFAPAPVRADVTGEGDVAPNMVIDVFGEQTTVVQLPFDGGVVEEDIIVGGTGMASMWLPRPIPPIGRVIVDNPAFTLPLESPNLFIAGAPEGLPGQSGTAGTQLLSGDSIGLVTITGFFSQWSVEDQVVVGGFGQGYLDVTAGAQLIVGDPNTSTNIEDIYVGGNEGSQGFVTINGFGSRVTGDTLIVGFLGQGRVDVQARARLESRSGAILGDDRRIIDGDQYIGSGTVVVDGFGSRWNIGDIEGPGDDDGLTIGNEGHGRVEVRNQGVVRVDRDTMLAVQPNSFGELIVNGRDSLFWTFRNLDVGVNALASGAEMHIEAEGVVRADGVTTIGLGAFVDLATGGVILTPTLFNGATPGTGGVIRGDGRIDTGPTGVVTNNGDIRNAAGVANLRERLVFTGPVINNDNIESVGGEMEFQGPVTNATADSEIVGIDAILRFRGGLVNNGRLVLDNTLVETLGTPAPIVSNAQMEVLANQGSTFITGDLTLGATNRLGMEIEQYAVSHLRVSDEVTLGGILDVSIGSGYIPMIGDVFEIITANSVTGMFSDVVDSVSGFDFEAVVEPTRVLLSVTAGFVFSGDFDGDGCVDSDDFSIWASNFGRTDAMPSDGDADGDGDVDGADFGIWQQQLGTCTTIVSAPEPAAGALALIALALLPRRRR